MTPRRLNLASLTTFAFLFAAVLGVLAVVVTAVAWNVLNGAGVFSDLQEVVAQAPGFDTFDVFSFVGIERVLLLVVLLSATGAVLLPVAAFLCGAGYNAVSRRIGAPLA